MKKMIGLASLALAVILVLAGCPKPMGGNDQPTTTTTTKTTISVKRIVSFTGRVVYREKNETVQFIVSVEPLDATNKTVHFQSSNEAIATVDNAGLVTVVSDTVWEQATITATSEDGNYTATCTIVVIQKPTATMPDANSFVTISAGSMPLFYDAGPSHVTLTKAFQICDHEVTQKEWCDVFGADNNPSHFNGSSGKEADSSEIQENRPVEMVNWYMAIAYCNKRSIKEGLTPCYSAQSGESDVDFTSISYATEYNWTNVTCNFSANGYRLPTEAEWEIAARGGVTGDVYAGTAAETDLRNYAWYEANSSSKTHAVKKKSANGYGLYDMSGNVFEWCWDGVVYGYSSSGVQTDPQGAPSASFHVNRGGGWNYRAWSCRASYRYSHSSDYCDKSLGFRLARSCSKKK
ncbi:MAG: SUMF1/EgtB/PvdO family nonheme iron enzyme [Treponema sp.]|nr:SUMF1/EgtB/PvdO family nonheme iron enzyme [Treponema sp.]